MAWRKSITFVIEFGLQEVIFEGDSEVVYKHLSAISSSLASFGHITGETRQLVSNFRFASFFHVKCSGNAVADKLAKLAKNSTGPQIWREDIHYEASSFVIHDKLLLKSFSWFLKTKKKKKNKAVFLLLLNFLKRLW